LPDGKLLVDAFSSVFRNTPPRVSTRPLQGSGPETVIGDRDCGPFGTPPPAASRYPALRPLAKTKQVISKAVEALSLTRGSNTRSLSILGRGALIVAVAKLIDLRNIPLGCGAISVADNVSRAGARSGGLLVSPR